MTTSSEHPAADHPATGQLDQFAPDAAPSPLVRSFLASEGFTPDPFQLEAFAAVDEESNVLVSAPTGSGKTLVGEYAAHRALANGGRCFYTTPVKALSNQKFRQFKKRFGDGQVGLLTGDHAIDSDAPIVVMTTEVLRNMIYAGSSALADLHCVVMDEIHYLGDRSRGVVWEEIILTLDPRVQLVGLSATLSNAGELGDWIADVRGETEVIQSDRRPVPLAHMLYTDGELVPVRDAVSRNSRGQQDQRGRDSRRPQWARRLEVIENLDDESLLPAIYFVFSRAGCDGAVSQMRRARLRLTTKKESQTIASHVDEAVRDLPSADLEALDFQTFRSSLLSGIAAHHAGMLPLFRLVVEELFTRGLIKVVFATETLALGIHMPARAVVLERTTKFNGDSHVTLTPSEYSQITGRAGRRGIDTKGTAVTLHQPDLDLQALAGLVDSPRFPLVSAFGPDYSMAVNLVERMGVDAATTLIGQSFAQYQTDRTLVAKGHDIAEQECLRDALREQLDAAGRSDEFDEYMRLRARATALERAQERDSTRARADAIRKAMLRTRPGEIITTGNRRAGLVATVLETKTHNDADPALLCLTDSGWIGWLNTRDFSAPPSQLDSAPVPGNRKRLNSRAKRALLHRMERLRGPAKSRLKRSKKQQVRKDPKLAKARKDLRAHPMHDTPEAESMARLHERWQKADARVTSLRSEVDDDAESLARRFRRITGLLTAMGYLQRGPVEDADDGSNGDGPHSDGPGGDSAGGDGPGTTELHATDAGRLLAGIHSEQDLLIAECLRRKAWNGLDAAGLAAVMAAIVAHPRSETAVREPADETLLRAIEATVTLATEIAEAEESHGLDITPSLDTGLSPVMHHWVSGGSLSDVLAASWQEGIELTAGDFVRSARLVIDALAQVGLHGDREVAATARSAVGHLRRGVVTDAVS